MFTGTGISGTCAIASYRKRQMALITTTMNIYVKSNMGEATTAMKALEAICATNVQPFTGEASPVM